MTDDCTRRIARGGWAEDRLAHRCTAPIGPWNTASNAAYLFVGLALLHRDPSPATWAMAVALGALAVGSGIYHAVKTHWSNQMDWIGMYMTFAALTVHAIVPTSTAAPWVMMALGAVLAWRWAVVLNGIGLNIQMGTFLVLSLLPGFFGETPNYHAPLALALFVGSYVLWHLDRMDPSPTGRYGHALWHVGTAVAIGHAYLSAVPQ